MNGNVIIFIGLIILSGIIYCYLKYDNHKMKIEITRDISNVVKKSPEIILNDEFYKLYVKYIGPSEELLFYKNCNKGR
ncbi:hypothetical protein NCTC12673_gp137 [Campylobacter phage NCTC12673]|uniref:Uncharacterized protein n=2 Tax=Fletchervirus NCTC12673 TaxID=934027 RepID=A0A1B0XVZ6_9CAUD|nr:hypothetical protein NCTC12673_gp137 [Campylobacter phage NCTC12673]YP_009321622.1 hypothetical protein BOX06_gp023 [Campylobacter phage PC14]AEA86480.1 hypothetical protein [Campylobacter phage NCTC12673]ANH51316.1 hypothetical protein PC14_00023 [Campylobacter phage PC14]